ncbi:hypothetical protein CRYUN_Cryun18bG0016500 [Craigia yunnanensis]
MGQTFRRATGRILSVDQSQPTKTKRPLGLTDEQKISRASHYENLDHERASRSSPENVLEERDTKYDAMLSQMVGWISAKPGGKLEMGKFSSFKAFFYLDLFLINNSSVKKENL